MNKQGLLPSCWGPMLWGFLHSIAYSYCPETEKKIYYDFFMNLGNILPCEDCKEHYKENLEVNELIKGLETNESFFRFVYDLHNKVNKKLNVPESSWPSYEQVKKRYSSFKGVCGSNKGICGSKDPSQLKVKIIESKNNYDNENLYAFIILILVILLLCALFFIFYKRKKIF